MSKRKYRTRRNLSDREVQREFDKWLLATERRGIDPNFTRWLCQSAQGFASVDGFSLIYERLEYSQHSQFLLDCMSAARLVLPDHAHLTGTKLYPLPGLLTAYCFKLFLECSFRSVFTTYRKNFPARYLTFGRLRTMPSEVTLRRFVSNLDSGDLERFLLHLNSINSPAKILLETRLELQNGAK